MRLLDRVYPWIVDSFHTARQVFTPNDDDADVLNDRVGFVFQPAGAAPAGGSTLSLLGAWMLAGVCSYSRRYCSEERDGTRGTSADPPARPLLAACALTALQLRQLSPDAQAHLNDAILSGTGHVELRTRIDIGRQNTA